MRASASRYRRVAGLPFFVLCSLFHMEDSVARVAFP